MLDSDGEEVFDRLTRLAVKLLGVPASFISLVDRDRDFYKSACGFGEPLASVRELTGPTFCHYTVERTTPLVIPDTAADPEYRDVPTVHTLGVAAYVGVPLVVGGETIGAFCTIDTKPREWTADEVEVLRELAASAQREMELRDAVRAAREASVVTEERGIELQRSNDQLQKQAVELEMQSKELHATTAQLEERTEAAEAANVAKAGFLSMMSHELRTPLTAITGYADLMQMGIAGDVTPTQADFLGRIRRAGAHLQTLIGDILQFTSLDGGHFTYEITTMRVDDVVAEAAELLAPQIAECGISFSMDPCEAGPGADDCLVEADPKRLRQILVNLLTNAVKFTPATGSVAIRSSARDGKVCISVTDTGRGIPAQELVRVFEPFVQLDRASTPARQQGVGLGLAICRKLAIDMKGELEVVSQPGQGSTFTVVLPGS